MSKRCNVCWRVSEPPFKLRPAPRAPISAPLNTEEIPKDEQIFKTQWCCKTCGAWQE